MDKNEFSDIVIGRWEFEPGKILEFKRDNFACINGDCDRYTIKQQGEILLVYVPVIMSTWNIESYTPSVINVLSIETDGLHFRITLVKQ